MPDLSAAPFREAKLMPVDLEVERRADGTILMRSRVPLRPYDANLARALLARCAQQGDKPALAKRSPGGGDWVFTTYAELASRIRSAAQWMLDHVPPGRAMVISSDNTPAVAIMSFAAWAVGVPVCPISAAYASLGGDYGRLRHVLSKVKPALIYAGNADAVARALDALEATSICLVTDTPLKGPGTVVDFAELIGTPATAEVDHALAAREKTDVAAYMLTSGSTGLPKIVPITFDNMGANTTQCMQAVGGAATWHETMLDWLPWHHAAGASVMRTTLLEGGTLYIDDGKPMPGLFDESLRNMREIAVSYINNVPAGYALLTEALEKDAGLRKVFFSKLHLMLYGGAGLPQHMLDRLQAQAVAETGHRIMMTSGYGATETVSAFMAIYFNTDKVGIGLPMPGVQLKLTPYDHRYEVRVQGPNVMSAYFDDPAQTARAFDDEGFYRLGDLAMFHNPDAFGEGLAFAGRLAEEFKLAQGNWVYGGQVRDALLKALSPLATDLALCDDNRPFLAVLIWPNAQGVASTLGADTDLAGPALRAALAERLTRFNEVQSGSSAHIKRAFILTEPPSANAHEISDKGTINRRTLLDRRRDIVERVYAQSPDHDVVVVT
jgi:feruloyl-CoA synthase